MVSLQKKLEELNKILRWLIHNRDFTLNKFRGCVSVPAAIIGFDDIEQLPSVGQVKKNALESINSVIEYSTISALGYFGQPVDDTSAYFDVSIVEDDIFIEDEDIRDIFPLEQEVSDEDITRLRQEMKVSGIYRIAEFTLYHILSSDGIISNRECRRVYRKRAKRLRSDLKERFNCYLKYMPQENNSSQTKLFKD